MVAPTSTVFEQAFRYHDDVINWKHCPRYWPFVRGFHRSPVNSPHKGQWRGALMFSLICAWSNNWANNGDAGELTRHRAHCDVTVMRMYRLTYCPHDIWYRPIYMHIIVAGRYRDVNSCDVTNHLTMHTDNIIHQTPISSAGLHPHRCDMKMELTLSCRVLPNHQSFMELNQRRRLSVTIYLNAMHSSTKHYIRCDTTANYMCV